MSTPARLPRAVAIGNFDGVHRGHQLVLRRIAARDLRATAVTFDPHPRAYFGQRVDSLCSLERRIELIRAAGIADVLVVPFDDETAACAPRTWVERFLEPIGTRVVCVGRDFRFGSGRAGDVALLRSMGLEVESLDLVDEISSSSVRELVRAGELERAGWCLGRPVEIAVRVAAVARARSGASVTRVRSARPAAALPLAGSFGVLAAGQAGVLTVLESEPWRAELHLPEACARLLPAAEISIQVTSDLVPSRLVA